MTVSTTGSTAEFATNGVTTNYPFYFKFLANEDLVVTYVSPGGISTVLTLGADYTVNGAGSDDGGSVVTPFALDGPGQLAVAREMDAFQQTSLRNQGKFLAETHEDVFDRLTMLIQQGFSIFSRALTRPLGLDYFFGQNRRITSLLDPVSPQDAATKNSVEAYVASVLEAGQGPINTAENVAYVDANNIVTSVQKGIYRQFNGVKRLFGKDGYRDGEQCVLLSYHEGLKKGGGEFYWDATGPKSSHNGGTVIDPLRVFPVDWTVKTSVEAWFAPSAAGNGVWIRKPYDGFPVTWFGALADGVTNDQPAYWACATAAGSGGKVIFPASATPYRMHWFYGFDNQVVIGYGARIDLFKLAGGPTVLAASGSNARYEGVYLNCLETNLPNVRASFEDRQNSHWYKCSFVGFRDAAVPNLNNGWGPYFKRCDNITLELCYLANNSQNDIAILEGSTNIRVIGCYGPALNINVEPNDDLLPIRGISMSGMKISTLLTQENSFTGNSSNLIAVKDCDVVNFFYDGAGVEFTNSRVRNIFPMPDTDGRSYAGPITFNGASGFSANLLRDQHLVSVSATDTGSSWQVEAGTIAPASRYAGVYIPHGRGIRLNPGNTSGTAILKSEVVNVTQNYTYLVSALTSAVYPADASVGQQLAVRWMNNALATLSTTIIPINRGAPGSSTALSLQSAIVKAPAGATKAQVLLGNSVAASTTASSDWYSIGMHLQAAISGGGGLSDPTKAHVSVGGSLFGTATSVPSSSPTQYYYRDYLQGDFIRNLAPTAAGYSGWVCVVSGTPGTWKGVGLIQA